jgi:hypothetical protein
MIIFEVYVDAFIHDVSCSLVQLEICADMQRRYFCHFTHQPPGTPSSFCEDDLATETQVICSAEQFQDIVLQFWLVGSGCMKSPVLAGICTS